MQEVIQKVTMTSIKQVGKPERRCCSTQCVGGTQSLGGGKQTEGFSGKGGTGREVGRYEVGVLGVHQLLNHFHTLCFLWSSRSVENNRLNHKVVNSAPPDIQVNSLTESNQ